MNSILSHNVVPAAPPPARPPKPPAAKPARSGWLRARYDAAQTTDQNKRHWANADALSANAANTPLVRRILRNRARYEAGNNGYCKGLLRTRRNDVIGTGPRLQLTLPATWTDPDFGTEMTTPPGAAREVERKWKKWADAAGVADDLRVMEESGDRDGECFGLFVTNPRVDDAVKLAVRLIEADQCATPDLWWADPHAVDGIRFDEWGNPVEYHFLKAHPGGLIPFNTWEYDRVDARYVLHWFDPDRPGQRRGVSSLAPSLPLYAQLRRFTGAVLSAAETAANHAAVLKTDQPAGGDGEDAPDADDLPENFDRVPLPINGAATLPAGWEITQLTPEQPTTTYPQFKAEVLTEAGAGLGAPRNVSTKSSAEYNYSSARLDHLPYRQDIRITRDRVRRVILDRLLRAWLHEASLIPGHLPAGLPPVEEWDWAWHWDGFESIDPVKDATADDLRLKNGTRTLTAIYAEAGADWEEAIRQKAREMKLARELEAEYGLAPGSLYPLTAAEQAVAPPPTTEEPADAASAV